jgi:uncharacterized repeat protein (TIGR04076 family)
MTKNPLPMPNKIEITIKDILEKGECPLGHEVGEKFNWPDDMGKICPHAVFVLYPAVDVLRFGGAFPWEDDPDKTSICCPDPNNPVVFEIRRIDNE